MSRQTFKVALPNGELRRFAVAAPPAFAAVAAQIRALHPALAATPFRLTWVDGDNDTITVANDDDVAEAVAAAKNGVVRLNVILPAGSDTTNASAPATPAPAPMDAAPATSSAQPEAPREPEEPQFDERGRVRHPRVTCDGCQTPLYGVRYKCAECWNTDFCEDCEAKNVHGDDHVLLKIKKPTRIDIYNSFRSGPFGGRRDPGHGHGCQGRWARHHDAASAARWAAHCANRFASAATKAAEAAEQQQQQQQQQQQGSSPPPPQQQQRQQQARAEQEDEDEFEAEFAEQLRVLHEMGFLDDLLNTQLLRARKGAVSAVIDQLIQLAL